VNQTIGTHVQMSEISQEAWAGSIERDCLRPVGREITIKSEVKSIRNLIHGVLLVVTF
jgi:hypothetical protein